MVSGIVLAATSSSVLYNTRSTPSSGRRASLFSMCHVQDAVVPAYTEFKEEHDVAAMAQDLQLNTSVNCHKQKRVAAISGQDE